MAGSGAGGAVLASSASLDLLAALAPSGGVAPHVAAELGRRLGDDEALMRDVVRVLDRARLLGRRPLPDPLPDVPAMAAHAVEADLEIALPAVLATDRRIDLLAAAAGIGVEELLRRADGSWIEISSGRFRLTDPVLGIVIARSADPLRAAQVHARFARLHADEGDDLRAAWHRARGALRRDPDVVEPLLSASRRLRTHGHWDEAFRAAVEAFDHAVDDQADAARVAAGTAALGAGWYAEATDWLAGVRTTASVGHRRAAFAPRMLADVYRTGTVHPPAPGDHRPLGDEPEHWREWGRACALGAIAAAEHGATAISRAWLTELREADRRSGADGALRDPVLALCALLDGEEPYEEASAHSLTGALARALHDAAEGGEGDDVLAGFDSEHARVHDLVLAGGETSPLAHAYRAVVESLVLYWRGRIDAARLRLHDAARRLPIAMPFAGLGALLSRRLDIIVDGAPGAITAGLFSALPRGIRPDPHQDLALQAYLAGDAESAAEHVQLWNDRGGPTPGLPLGLLDEFGSEAEPEPMESSDATTARRLCQRVRGLSGGARTQGHLEIAEAARGIGSPYLRGRVEALLGSACAIRDEAASARRHLRTARRLFDECGAVAWRRSVETRLAHLGGAAAAETQPITVPALDPLAACRAAWSERLTDRELEVAMLIVEGAQNRAIADRLDVSVRTVEVHAGKVFAKLGVRSRVELTVLGHRTNLYT